MKHKIAIFVLLSGIVSTLFLIEELALSITIITILTILFLAVLAIGVTTIKWNYFIKSVNRVKPGKICFTFDDGPSENTLKILDVLDKHEVKATFFVIGEKCIKHPEIIQKMIKSGHFIGNHSFSHQNNIGWSSTKSVIQEIEKCNLAIENTAGYKTNLYRPPFGVTNPNIARAILSTNMLSIGWTIRTFDTQISDPQKLISKVKPRINNKGHIVLMHDTCEQSVLALDAFIQHCKETGLEIVNLNPAEIP